MSVLGGTKVGEGAQVYATTCARCHNARSGTERTDSEWGPIVAHMRARANMTKGQAEAVLAFLRATNIPEPGSSVAGGTSVPDPAAAVVLPSDMRLALMTPRLTRLLAKVMKAKQPATR